MKCEKETYVDLENDRDYFLKPMDGQITIHHYIDKKLFVTAIGGLVAPKFEIKNKMVFITENDVTRFVCKVSEFISMQF